MTARLSSIPSIISRLLDIDYEHKICVQAFPPGKHYAVPSLPNITALNSPGSFHIEADRLASIDGESLLTARSSRSSGLCLCILSDPWRLYTPHSICGGEVDVMARYSDHSKSSPVPPFFRLFVCVLNIVSYDVASATGKKTGLKILLKKTRGDWSEPCRL
ncbi:hypothetical protein V8E53_011144 [Lactarius tabidus]|jgi:hypothetical protein